MLPEHIVLFNHTAKCKNCGALLYYPYPEDASLEIDESIETIQKHKKSWFEWYRLAAKLNHINFSNMFLFTIANPRIFF